MDPWLTSKPILRRFASAGVCWIVAAAGFFLCSALADDSQPVEQTAPAPTAKPAAKKISFNEQIRPIFAKHCVACHGGVKQASGLSFIYRDQALAETESGMVAITPGDPEQSYLLARVSDPDPETRMPPQEHGPPLGAEEIDLLRQWIVEGAKWEEPWSFMPPRPQTIPAVQQTDWPALPLDNFILAELEKHNLAPSPPATKAAWLRRASLDLIGIPPTKQEYDDFAADAGPDAKERVVDRLLASPRFGERWASMWLDLARYADTVGFEKDPNRTIWPYRDWVIRAFNDDMPYDEFTIKQLAGDLLPNASLDDRLATAFHRNTQTNTEGGTDDEEYRTSAVIDRVKTTWQTWEATTFGCAQCHSHPYDPIRNEEFYKFVAVFNTSRDADVNEDFPLLGVPEDRKQWGDAARLDACISHLRRSQFALEAELAADESLWTPLRAKAASGSGQTKLVIRDDPTDGVSEVLTEGTVTSYGTFTLDFPIEGLQRITAVRIGALPSDVAAAIKIPESGFVLTHFTASLVDANGKKVVKLPLKVGMADEPEPIFDADESLNDDDRGWGEYTRMSRPRRAIFILDRPVRVAAGQSLRLELQFNRTDSGEGALAIRRGRFAASTSEKWIDLIRSPEFTKTQCELKSTREERSRLASVDVPVMGEQAASAARHSFTFIRGNWMDKDAEVQPATPAVLPPLPTGSPVDRMAVARWLVADDNPLTARVLVNRLWQELFGVGIVETAEDFGTSGSLPSHPELLDYLALRMERDHHWSVKKMLRELVLSATYAQDNAASPDRIAADPRNRLLSRGPRTRLSAEMIRDQALALSGRLSDKMYGPPVMPPQPKGVWRSVYNGERWITSKGEDRYRRAVYTFVKRTSGYPSLLTFDMPSREVCTARRIATNTPLQALVTLNDKAYIELAEGFAERMAATATGDPAVQMASGYRLATGREIASTKLNALTALYAEALAAYDPNSKAAKKMASTREQYALSIVASAMLNLDEVLTK